MNRKTMATVLMALCYIGLSACSSNGKKAETTVIAPTSGGGQSAAVDTTFQNPLVATVMMGTEPASSVMVTFTAPGNGASGTFANGTATETDMTNSSGVATSSAFKANGTTGTYAVAAAAPNAAAVNFTLTNTAGPAAGLSVASGSGQTATVSTAFTNPLVVQVVDSNGNAVSDSGLSVTFTAPGNGASGTFANGTATETDMTNASGVATSSTFKANATAGGYNVTAAATISGAQKSVNFSLTNAAVMPAGLSAASGGGQSAIISTAFGKPLAAQVVDSKGNPVSDAGVSVTFTAPGSGASGTFGNGTATETDMTNSSGLATSSTFKANGSTGGYNVTASATINGATQTAKFSLTNTAGPAAGLSVASGSGQTATVSTAFTNPLAVQVVDSQGNPVSDSGLSVTFTAPGSGASGTFGNGTATETDMTNGTGLATSSTFKANATAGAYNVTASATINGTLKSVNFSLTNAMVAAAGLSASSGSGQSAGINTTFAAPLVVQVVDSKGNPVSDAGLSVTFTAPASGASGTFANGTATETDMTNASGVATSSAFKANGTAGGYNVTASATINGGTQTATFGLTNTSTKPAVQQYVFYLSGAEGNANNFDIYNFVSLAGTVIVDTTTGAVTGGVQDYNDGTGITSPQPGGDDIVGGQLTVNASGQGTLTLITDNTKVGVNGTETLGVQFVNLDHALIIQFDGTATSSGSLDLQAPVGGNPLNPAPPPSGNFAYTLSGVDTNYNPAASGGVLKITGNTLAGTFDVNDNGTVVTNTAFSGNISNMSSYGRGTITDTGIAITINYYFVGSEAVRLIVVDSNATAAGSAFGQGDTTFTNAKVPSPTVFALAGNTFSGVNAIGGNDALGQFSTSNTSASPSDFTGVADDNELGNGVAPIVKQSISGTYTLSNSTNGYGSLTFSGSGLGSVSKVGIYMTDPSLNLNDPNNSSGGGGALLLDLGANMAGVTGLLSPQTDTSQTDFAGNYAMGWQDFNSFTADCTVCEFDFLGQASVTSGAISGTGLISDPFNTLTANRTPSDVAFSGTPEPDASNPGRYTLYYLHVVIGTGYVDLYEAVYQASGSLLYWLDEDSKSVFIGPIEAQGSLTGLPAVKPAETTTATKK